MTVQDIAADAIQTERAGAAAPMERWGTVAGLAQQQGVRLEPACWGVDPEAFFGPADSSTSRSPYLWEQRAVAVCVSCPLKTACLTEALTFPADQQYGVVGGMTAEQRRAALRSPRRGRGRAQRLRRSDRGPRPARP